jgi:hypothetical protein
MGVPAFFKWLSVKYPKIVVDCVEEKAAWTDDGEQIPVDSSKPNPNGLEYDNLFLDMNGIIHPASHPEDRPPPETEDDMFLAIVAYLERVFAAVRRLVLTRRAIERQSRAVRTEHAYRPAVRFVPEDARQLARPGGEGGGALTVVRGRLTVRTLVYGGGRCGRASCFTWPSMAWRRGRR